MKVKNSQAFYFEIKVAKDAQILFWLRNCMLL